jgi:hypothetical protein
MRLPLAVALLVVSACATTPRPRETGELVFWRIARADGTGGSAHLLGTLHIGKEELALDPAIASALEASDELVLEVAPEELGSPLVTNLIIDFGQLPLGKTFRELIAPEVFAAVERRFRERKIPLDPWLGWEPWVVTLALASDQLESEGFSREVGVERSLAADAIATQKPARGLETTAEQIARFDSMPLATQELLLRDAVMPAKGAPVDTLALAWQRGDLAALARAIFASPSGPDSGPYFDAIYHARNRDFAADIAQLVDAGGRWFVALGAGHMVGETAIPQLLAARGYQVERIPKTPRARRSAKE